MSGVDHRERERWRQQKARQRQLAKVGSKTETVMVGDWDAWRGVLEAAGFGSTEAFIEAQCRNYRLERAEKSRVGLLAREGGSLPEPRLIKAANMRRHSEDVHREAQDLAWHLFDSDDS